MTGDNGFVGAALLRHFEASHPDATILQFLDPSTGKRADIRDHEAVFRAVANARPSAVIHLAAIAAPAEAKADPRLAWDVNFMGTFNLAQAIQAEAPQAHLIWASSAEVYGLSFNAHSAPICEYAAMRPMSPYGATKAATEVMLGQMARTGLNLTVFRPFNHTGPGQTASYVVPAFASQIAEIQLGRRAPVVSVGDLSPRRDFLDVKDVVRAYAAAALGPAGTGQTYNLSNGNPVSIKELLDMLCRLAGIEVEIVVDEARMRPSDVPVASGDPSLASADLGWRPAIPLERTLADVLDYWRNQH